MTRLHRNSGVPLFSFFALVALVSAPRVLASGACVNSPVRPGCFQTQSQLECKGSYGGTYLGDGSVCPTPAPAPTGACGFSGSCRDGLTSTQCSSLSELAKWFGGGSTCAISCPLTPFGANGAVGFIMSDFGPTLAKVTSASGQTVAQTSSPIQTRATDLIVLNGAVTQPYPGWVVPGNGYIQNGTTYTLSVNGTDKVYGRTCTGSATVTPPGIPVPPSALAGATDGTLSWTAPGSLSFVKTYTVRSGASASGPFTTAVGSGVAGTSFKIPSSSVGPYYVVSSVNPWGEGPVSKPALATPSAPAGWANTSWQAADVAVGANGAVWFLKSDNSVWQVVNGTPTAVGGGATRIAVDPSGNAWVVNAGGQIYRWTGSTWVLLTGAAIDIGIGGNGKVWILATDGTPSSWSGTAWVPLGSGGGTRISVDPAGNPWVTNGANEIWRYDGKTWQPLSGAASDVSVGPDGVVYVVGMSAGTGGNQIWRWNGSSWVTEDGVFGSVVAAGPGTHAWVGRSAASSLPVISR